MEGESGCLGTLAGVIGLILVAPIVDMRMKYLGAIDRRLSTWKEKYQLSADQVREIRRIEMDFHDFRSVAFGSKKRSTEEIDAHCGEIAAHMTDSSAEVFLRDGDDQRE